MHPARPLRRLLAAATTAIALILVAGCTLPKDEDEPYLEGLCGATLAFSQGLAAADTEATITGVIERYRAEVEPLVPPDDLVEYHDEFLAYLDAVMRDPESAGSPPEPPADVERRLDSVAFTLDECRETDFFGNPPS